MNTLYQNHTTILKFQLIFLVSIEILTQDRGQITAISQNKHRSHGFEILGCSQKNNYLRIFIFTFYRQKMVRYIDRFIFGTFHRFSEKVH